MPHYLQADICFLLGHDSTESTKFIPFPILLNGDQINIDFEYHELTVSIYFGATKHKLDLD